ncbi:dnaJ homolog subfamily C member 24 [Genypterus blacodes]|uniref:dnaJ homolog subfamily C member 24 n=1 Tax=Genypterus blacodes TaxID=154954 RepID=UPI003F75AB44
MCESSEKDLYSVLGAWPSDSVQQLRHRYQQLALQYHPDRCGATCSPEENFNVGKFLEIDAAWKVLGDETSRREYDVQRRALELKQDGPMDSAVCLDDMTWNQDESVYTYCCRCGGGFSVTEEELQEETQQEDGEEEGEHKGVLVSCDSCSLTLCVANTSHAAHINTVTDGTGLEV